MLLRAAKARALLQGRDHACPTTSRRSPCPSSRTASCWRPRPSTRPRPRSSATPSPRPPRCRGRAKVRRALGIAALGLVLVIVAGTFDAEPLYVGRRVPRRAGAGPRCGSCRRAGAGPRDSARAVAEDEPLDVRSRPHRRAGPGGALRRPAAHGTVALPGRRRVRCASAALRRRGRGRLGRRARPSATARARRADGARHATETRCSCSAREALAPARDGSGRGRRAAARDGRRGRARRRARAPGGNAGVAHLLAGAGPRRRDDGAPAARRCGRHAAGRARRAGRGPRALRGLRALAGRRGSRVRVAVRRAGQGRRVRRDAARRPAPDEPRAGARRVGAPARPPGARHRGGHPSLSSVAARVGPVYYVTARVPSRPPRALQHAPASGRTLVVPGAWLGRRPTFEVAGCFGYDLEPARGARRAA
jgi:hypothetical protein